MTLVFAGQLVVAFLAGLLLALFALHMMRLRILPLAFFAWFLDIFVYGTAVLNLTIMIWLGLTGSFITFPFWFWPAYCLLAGMTTLMVLALRPNG